MIFGDAYSAHDRAERIIAAGRVLLAAISLIGVSVVPAETATQRAYWFLVAYSVYAVVLAAVVWRAHLVMPRVRTVTHFVDFAVFATLYIIQNHLAAAFFLFFVFSILSATLRWQWRGTLWTALAAIVLSAGMGFYQSLVRDTFLPNQLLVRSVYVTAVAVLLVYLILYEFRLRRELSRLAEWSPDLPADFPTILRDVIRQAADLLRAPRALIVLEEFDEPWVHVAVGSASSFEVHREAPDAFDPLVDPHVAGCDFLVEDLDVPAPRVLYATGSRHRRWRGQPVHDGLKKRFGFAAVLGVRVASENFSGYLFWLDRHRLGRHELRLGRLVARQAAARLDQFYVVEQRRRAAAAEERVHLARDLHDGLLQSLTAIALKLETLRTQLVEDPDTAQKHLVAIQRLVLAEQRYLRFFIRQLKPAARPDLDAGLLARLELLAHRVELEWGLNIDLRCPYVDEAVGIELRDAIFYTVSEAVVNAARHAKASVVSVDIDITERHVRILVEDNGQGFPFRGRYTEADLMTLNQGPRTLRERVAALRGSLVIDSAPTGARIEILLPRGGGAQPTVVT